MYGVETLTPAAADPLTAAEVRDWLRLNTPAEDALLAELVKAAAEQFESETNRPVLAATYRQYVTRFPAELVLGRAGVTAVVGVSAYSAAGVAAAVGTGTYRVDLLTPPARVQFTPGPAPAALWSPAGYVEFTAGWATAAAVPREVRFALKALVGHWYHNREAYTDRALKELELGWRRVTARYKLGLSGDWGQ